MPSWEITITAILGKAVCSVKKRGAVIQKCHSVKFLRNTCGEVAVRSDSTMICGVDGRQTDEPISPDVVKYLQSMTKGRADIILSHSPLVFDLIDSNQDVLMLAGDTDGGQIPLPS